ncbi:MAG TPA: DUF3048 domain-containing protein [Vitreimonas sp.]|nr:DUF3048 domain-containing protein [Vitreimonas sp.]
MQKKTLLMILALYIASSAISYGVFSFLAPAKRLVVMNNQTEDAPVVEEEEDNGLESLLTINPSEPKDQPCPLNGQLYTTTEKAAWEQKRPLAVMIENTPDARPQSGLGDADVVFEAVAEGGITRFMGMFYCDVQAYDTPLAPIRSARVYYMSYAAGFNRPLYVHVGGANTPGPADALGILGQWGWNGENDLNQFSIGYPTFVRDYNRIPGKEIATEHTMVTSTQKLWDVGVKREWTNMSPSITGRGGKVTPGTDWKEGFTGWEFEDGQAGAGTAPKVSYEFWSGYDDYAVEWNYDAATNTYLRSQGGEKHVDLNNDHQIGAKNVIVLLTTEKGPIDEKKHMLYETTGTGDALLFKNGEATKITWSKKTHESELQFLSAGKPVKLNRGMTWISILDKKAQVTY